MLNTEERINKFCGIHQLLKSGFSLDEVYNISKKPSDLVSIHKSLDLKNVRDLKSTYREQFINGFVYIIQQEGVDEAKIGFASNVVKRLRALQTGSSKKLKVIRIYRGNTYYEKLTHKYLDNQRLSGEWFSLSESLLEFTDNFFDFFMLPKTELYVESINNKVKSEKSYKTARSQTSYKERGNIYAVKKGRIPGIYYSWSKCSAQVDKFKGGVYKKFNTMVEAEAFLKN